ncbi:MAG: GAF domain-containing protein [Candidatus Bipolaricaulia bacterium]
MKDKDRTKDQLIDELETAEIQRKQVEEALQESELKYRTLIERMSEGLLQVDNDDVIQFVNDRFCDMVGYSRDELLGKDASKLFLREEDRNFMRERNYLRTQGISDRYEIQVKKRSGEIVWLQIGGAPIVDEQGAIIGSIGVHTDITERKRAENRIRSVNRFMRVMNETSNLEELMNVILEQVIDMIPNADGGSFVILNEQENVFEFRAARGWDLETLKQIRFSRTQTIPAMLGQDKPTIVSGEEIEALDKRHQNPEIVEKFKEAGYPKSSIIIPVHIDGEMVGYFSINNKIEADAFGEEDLRLIEEIQDQTILAIKNARMSEEQENSLQELQQRNLELATLYVVASTVSGSLDLDVVLHEALDGAMELINTECSTIRLMDESNQELVLATYQGLSPESIETFAKKRFKLGEGGAGRVAQSGQPLVIQNLIEDPRLVHRELFKKEGLQSGVIIPLKSKDRSIGVLFLGDRTARLFTEEEVQLLMAIGHQIGMAIESAQLYDTLRTKEEQLRSFVNRLIQVQEEERRLVAYDIHDDLIQLIISASMYLNTGLDKLGSNTPKEVQTVLEEGLSQLEQAITEARRIVVALRPSALDDLGLIPAIQDQLDNLQQETGWQVAFEENLGEVRFDPAVEVVVYRIIQEALTNAKKHAATDQVQVAIERRPSHLNVEVQDWGIGFDPKQPHPADEQKRKPLGLIAMQERANLLGGRFTIESAPGQGTTVRAEIPLRRG